VRTPALPSNGAESAAWPALVESIAIDPAYDGEVFRATLADAPLKKRSTVAGRYVVALPTLPATVAVRVWTSLAASDQRRFSVITRRRMLNRRWFSSRPSRHCVRFVKY
jgi:hypothetical protein